jgi:hypothetical protein
MNSLYIHASHIGIISFSLSSSFISIAKRQVFPWPPLPTYTEPPSRLCLTHRARHRPHLRLLTPCPPSPPLSTTSRLPPPSVGCLRRLSTPPDDEFPKRVEPDLTLGQRIRGGGVDLPNLDHPLYAELDGCRGAHGGLPELAQRP